MDNKNWTPVARKIAQVLGLWSRRDPTVKGKAVIVNTGQARIQGGGAQGAHAPPIFGLAVPNLSLTLHARTPMTPPAPPPLFSNPGSAPAGSVKIMSLSSKRKCTT